MITQFRLHFPFFADNPDSCYLDSAATTLKPQVLLDSTSAFYCSAGSVHRSQYDAQQTALFEKARRLVATRFHVADSRSVVWCSGTTHAINLVAHGLAHQLSAQDEIVISIAEHHANFIPWQQLAQQTGARLIVLPVNREGQIEADTLQKTLSSKTKIVALNLVSNVSGIRQPMEKLIPLIRQYASAKIVLDIAQAVCSEKVNTTALDADFYVFSAHKLYGPTGVGVLIGKLNSLEQLRPMFYGGKMVKRVTTDELSLADLPYRLEAGTPNIAGVIGFGAVLEWLEKWDNEQLNQDLAELSAYLYKRLKNINNLQIIGSNALRTTFSFTILGIHQADIAAILNEQQIAIRVGEHCAQPYLHSLNKGGTLRVSLAHYNNKQDIDRFITGLEKALMLLEE